MKCTTALAKKTIPKMHFCVEGNAKEKYVSIKINCNSLFRNDRYMLHEMTWQKAFKNYPLI